MSYTLRWILSVISIGFMQYIADYLLPIHMERIWVIIIATIIGVLWKELIDNPLMGEA